MHELTDDKFAAVNGRVDRPGMVKHTHFAPRSAQQNSPDRLRTERRRAPVGPAKYQDNVMLTSMLPRVALE